MSTTIQATYTPGPWKLLDYLEGDEGNLIDDTYQAIEAGVGYFDNDEGGTLQGFRLSGCMNRADAVLISAAPELLQALKAFMALPHLEDDICDHTGPECKVCAAISLAKKAIAKAEAHQ